MPHNDVPGARWRVLSHAANDAFEVENRGVFDELVVDNWLHIEKLEPRRFWFRVGDAEINVEIDANGDVRVDVERGAHGPVNGRTSNYEPPT